MRVHRDGLRRRGEKDHRAWRRWPPFGLLRRGSWARPQDFGPFATRFPANSRTARSVRDARFASSAPPIVRAENREARRKSRKQDTVEGAGSGDKIIPVGCAEHRGNHGVDRLGFDAHVVSAALLIGGSRSPIEKLLVAGRQRLLPAIVDHVEVEADAASFKLRGIDRAHPRFDAGAFEVSDKSKRKTLLVARCGEYLE